MCVAKCPDKFMTLVKARLIPSEFEYYKQFCKEGVTNQMVSQDPGLTRPGLDPQQHTHRQTNTNIHNTLTYTTH